MDFMVPQSALHWLYFSFLSYSINSFEHFLNSLLHYIALIMYISPIWGKLSHFNSNSNSKKAEFVFLFKSTNCVLTPAAPVR